MSLHGEIMDYIQGGTLEGYKQTASKDKWLYVHGLKKWEFFYSDEGVSEQKRFLDY